jgi:hypothetical protein
MPDHGRTLKELLAELDQLIAESRREAVLYKRLTVIAILSGVVAVVFAVSLLV